MHTTFQEIITPVRSASFVFAKQTPNTFPEHWHTMAEFIMATKESCIYTVNRERIELSPGDVLLIWPTELHETLSNQDSVLLQFNDDLITGCKDFDVYYHNLRNIHNLREYSPALNEKIAENIRSIQALHSNPSELFSEPKVLIMIYEMLISLCTHLQADKLQPESASGTVNQNFYVIKKACSFINENFDRSLTELEVAEYCGFSTYYFSKIFHEYTQETFPEYLTKKRLSAATKLLFSETISIADVAYQSGFQSISNFNKVFKKAMGCTPLQYRKLYSDENNH